MNEYKTDTDVLRGRLFDPENWLTKAEELRIAAEALTPLAQQYWHSSVAERDRHRPFLHAYFMLMVSRLRTA